MTESNVLLGTAFKLDGPLVEKTVGKLGTIVDRDTTSHL
jgi:hypothetical protein